MKIKAAVKKAVALTLIVSIVLCLCPVALADSKEKFGTLPITWFSEKKAQNTAVMIKEDHVYIEIHTLAEKFGYKAKQDGNFFSLVRRNADDNITRVIRFKSNSSGVYYLIPLFGSGFNYDMPCRAVKNDRGFWVPFVYTLKLLDSGFILDTCTVTPEFTSVLGSYYNDLMPATNNQFDIVDELGDSYARLALCETVNIWNGWIHLDPYYINNAMMEFKYLEDICVLFCSESQEELRQEAELYNTYLDLIKDAEFMHHFDKASLGNSDVTKKELENLEEMLENSSSASPQANQMLGTLSKARKEKIMNRTLETFSAIADCIEFATYYVEFQKQDKASLNALKDFVSYLKKNDCILSDNSVKTLDNYLKDSSSTEGILKHSAIKFFLNNWDSLLLQYKGNDLRTTLFQKDGNLTLIAWDLASSWCPYLKNGLDNTEKSQLALYLQVTQDDAHQYYRNAYEKLTDDFDSKEAWTDFAGSLYTYLKMCHIARQNGIGIAQTYYDTNKNAKEKKQIGALIKSLRQTDKKVVSQMELYYLLSGSFDDCDYRYLFGMIPPVEKESKTGYDDTDKKIAGMVEFIEVVELTPEDKNAIGKLLQFSAEQTYDSKDPSQEGVAMYLAVDPIIGLFGMPEYPEKENQMTIISEFYGSSYVNDPLKAFKFDPSSDDMFKIGYAKYDGKAVDWLLRNILNFEPSHSSSVSTIGPASESEYNDTVLKYYYHDGYYYVEYPSGLGDFLGYHISFNKTVSDGSYYYLEIKWQSAYDDEDTVISFYATLSKKTVDGKDYWTIVRLSNTSYFDFSPYYPDKPDNGWKNLYYKRINTSRLEDGDVQYALAFIDNDNTPELIIERNTYAGGGEVCGVYKGKLFSLQVSSYGLQYIERKNLLLNSYGHMDAYGDTVYSIRNGKFVKSAEGYYGLDSGTDLSGATGDIEDHYTYYWEGKKASKEQYSNKLNHSFNTSLAARPYNRMCNAKIMIFRIKKDFYDVYPINEEPEEYY